MHILAEFFDTPKNKLTDCKIEEQLKNILRKAKVTCLIIGTHFFHNGGYTAFALLAESHVSIHTYPEHGSAFIDIFTCGDVNPKAILQGIEEYMHPGSTNIQVIQRGQ